MTARTRARLTLAIAAILVIALAGGIGYAIASRGNTTDDTPATAATTTSDGGGDDDQVTNQYPAQTTPSDAGSDQDTPPTVVAAQKFLPAYTNADGSDKAWIKSLTDLTTPTMLVSLRTSDRDAAATLAGGTLAATSGGDLLVVKDGHTLASLELIQMPVESDSDADPDDAPWVISGIDFTNPPENTALPLPSKASQAMTKTVQPAMTALLAQPGGLTDKARTSQVKEAFTHPDKAPKIKRPAGKDKRVVTGNVQDAQVTVADDKTLAVTATMPWQVDGTDDVRWATYTVLVERDEDGTWIPVDATA